MKITGKPVKTHNAAGLLPYVNNGELKFLLIRSSLGWEFPKGHIEEGETRLDTAKRETQEETGLIINNIHPSFIYVSNYFITKNYSTGERLKVPEPKTVTYFLGEALTEDVELSFEHSSYGWFIPCEANKRLKYSSKKEVLEHAMAFFKI